LNAFRDRRLDFDFHLCTSRDGAMRKLSSSPYELVISDVRLAELNQFSLIKHIEGLGTFMPFVVTANLSNQEERESVREVLGQGAFDLISLPPESEQTENIIRVALWQSKLMTLITCKEIVQEQYREHLAAYPWGNDVDPFFKRTLTAIQDSIATYQRSVLRTEPFADLAMKVKTQARARALERLDNWQN
jgi:DNA-binding NtrC family response regulator